MQSRVRDIIRRTGFDVVRFRGDLATHQRHLLDTCRIDTVVDVGANEGQYAARLRLLGYDRQIVSFEPLPDAGEALERRAAADGRWAVHRVAIGAFKGTVTLNVSANFVSSSLLEMTSRHVHADPRSGYISAVEVPMEPLDAYLSGLKGQIWLKVDVQGAEFQVLDGAKSTIANTKVIQAELSLREVYRNGPSALDVISRLADEGFRLIDIERGFTDGNSGALLQADGIFARPEVLMS